MEGVELPDWENTNIIKYKRNEQERIEMEGEELPGWQSNDARKGLAAARRKACT